MPYDIDSANPTDSSVVSAFPSNERDSRTATENSIDVEHDVTEGVHRFGRGITSARNGITTWVDGSIWFNTDRIPGETVVDVYNGTNWDDSPDWALVDVEQAWSALQYGTWNDATYATGNITVDWSNGNYQKVTLTEDSTFVASTNTPAAGSAAQMTFEMTQDGLGPWTIAYGGTEYEASYGSMPDLTSEINARDYVVFTLQSDGQIEVLIRRKVEAP